MLQPGTYTGKLTDYGITQTQAGKPQLKCTFEIIQGAETFLISWFGSFNAGKAQEMTIKTLCGVLDLFAEPNEIEHYLATIAEKGVASELLNQEKEYALVIEHDTYNGKTRPKIKWINNTGTAQKFDRIAQTEAKKMFSGLNLGGTVAAFKAENPGAAKKASTKDIGF